MTNEHDTQAKSHPNSDASELAGFDERAFVKSARVKSMRRSVLISVTAVLCGIMLLAGGWVAWERVIQGQSDRIGSYLYELVPLSQPNTFLAESHSSYRRFPGSRSTYLAYRPVGGRPLSKGEVTVEFDFWGGEVVTGARTLNWTSPAREFSGTELSPALRFLHPGSGVQSTTEPQPEEREYVRQIEIWTRDAKVHLSSAPASSTAELAVSFRELKTSEEVRALLGDDVALNWGAVDVWEGTDGAFVPREGNMVGISFIGPDGGEVPLTVEELEKNLPSRLRSVAHNAPKGTAERCIQSAEYIDRSGVKFYGAVVTGPISRLRGILDNEAVTAVVLGFVTQPWE
jgi:hypothetical protein